MKETKQMSNLICELEYIIGDQCYNPNSYDGYTGEEGCAFRYPVYIRENNDDTELTRYKYSIPNVEFEQLHTMKYKFGSNHLFIGNGLIKVLQLLEERYDIDFNELESEFLKKNPNYKPEGKKFTHIF